MPKAVSDSNRRHVTQGGLVRETAYLFEDEEQALHLRAEKDRCSKSEVIRRALRAYLKLSTPADI